MAAANEPHWDSEGKVLLLLQQQLHRTTCWLARWHGGRTVNGIHIHKRGDDVETPAFLCSQHLRRSRAMHTFSSLPPARHISSSHPFRFTPGWEWTAGTVLTDVHTACGRMRYWTSLADVCVSHEFSPLVSPDWAPLFTLLCYREKDNTKTRANKYLPTYPHLNNPITDMQSGFSWAVAHVYAQCIWEWTGLSNWMSKVICFTLFAEFSLT